ncbi:fasciclin domain-containing protein [Sarcina sp. JB2]|uniref:Fasciclin domain-containing protein n=1 Tax=Candidatus Sarcina troglodytae TaxID=2726954 RepID=A0ACD1BGN0_9CLOT|nr:fasciclin domain-containing protein [Sarcina sp. JB2]QPJ86388.1 fasciclin domain-containing protein [Sarcina sp. JB2]
MKKKIVIMIVLILFFTQTPLLISVKENMNTQRAILGQFVNYDNIVEVLSKQGNFKTLIKALHKANLLKVLEGDGVITIFAPTDEAFSKLSKKSLNNILDETNRKELINILSYHITIEKVMPDSIEDLNGKYIIMLNGEKAKITVQNGEIYINDIKCGDRIETKNGIVYPIDTVMIYQK